MSEQILKEILSEMKEIKSKVTSIEGELREFKQEVNERFNKVEKQAKDNFELLFEEYGRVHSELDTRISALEK